MQPAFAQEQRGRVDSASLPVLSQHYQDEFTLDKPTDPAAWNSQQGFHASFSSEDDLYFRTEVPQLKETSSWSGCGWKGERLNGQIVVWSADTLEQVRFKLGDLVDGHGHKINKNNISLNMVRYVLANYPYGSDKVDCGGSPYKDGYLMPDRFEQFDRFDVPGKTVRPVWMTVNIPAGTWPGRYKGNIEVIGKGFSKLLALDIEVQNQLLPPPHDWKFRLDLWQNPWVLAWDN
ncbi:MAG TPA: hypothetical protein VHS53_02780, partial [Mucilaginibacter sp.]|nr:hypothetical protein [Mucilaginibacter sp.]